MDCLSPLVARGALQMPDTGLGQLAISKYFFSPSWPARTGLICVARPDILSVQMLYSSCLFRTIQSVTGGSGMGMMIVVPSFTEG